jgi:integrase
MYERKKLSQLVVDRVRPPPGGRLEIADTGCPGLTLRVSHTGRRTFTVFWKVGESRSKRQRRKTLHTDRLDEARDTARRLLDEVGRRGDARSHTFAEVAKEYLAAEAAHLAPITIYDIEGTYRRYVLPAWGRRPLRDITTAEVAALLDGLSLGNAREVRKYVSALFSWSVERDYAGANPVAALRKKTRQRLAAPRDRGRALTNDELKALWGAAGAMGYPYGPFYQLLMLTGQRPYEWRDARWREITNDALTIPRERFKTRLQSHTVPLVPAVRAILEALPRCPECDWLLHQRGKCAAINSSRAADLPLGDAVVYDLRKTCATRLAELGVAPHVVDLVQSRQLTPLQRTYIHHDYAAEKRAALAKYARHLLKVVG